jgi:hypothetical protein
MKNLSSCIIALLFALQSNGQIANDKIERIKDSLCNGYRPAPRIIYSCQFGGPDIFLQISKNPLAQKVTQASGFWLEKIGKDFKAGDKQVVRNCWGPVEPVLKFTNPLRISDYVSTLGVICRQELKLDKLTPMPVRFRLGSLEYVNWMERKPNAVNPNR